MPRIATVHRIIEDKYPELRVRERRGRLRDKDHTLLYDTIHLDTPEEWNKVKQQIEQLVGHLDGVRVSFEGAEVRVDIRRPTRTATEPGPLARPGGTS